MWRGITQEDIGLFMDRYSLSDSEIIYQLKLAKGWCFTHGARGHKKDWGKFLNNWFSNASRYALTPKGKR
jgi:hypothetical protein